MPDITKLINDDSVRERIQKIIENSPSPEIAAQRINQQEIEKLWQYHPDECSYDCDYCRD